MVVTFKRSALLSEMNSRPGVKSGSLWAKEPLRNDSHLYLAPRKAHDASCKIRLNLAYIVSAMEQIRSLLEIEFDNLLACPVAMPQALLRWRFSDLGGCPCWNTVEQTSRCKWLHCLTPVWFHQRRTRPDRLQMPRLFCMSRLLVYGLRLLPTLGSKAEF